MPYSVEGLTTERHAYRESRNRTGHSVSPHMSHPSATHANRTGRFVLAATEHLHKRIAKMKERIRQLEDALAILHAKGSNEPHPLLRDDLLSANTEHDDEDMTDTEPTPVKPPPDVIDAFGTLSVSEHGVSRFFGPTGGAEVRGQCSTQTP